MSKKGFFLVLEGIEGVGKSTCLKFIENYLQKQGIKSIITREPGGTSLGEKLRDILLHQSVLVSAEAELLIMFAARVQHVQEVINPHLQLNQWVISDRFTESSYAYQGGGRNIPLDRINILEKWIDLQSDLVLLFDMPVELALNRTDQRRALDRIESEQIDFFERARRVYLDRAKKMPKYYKIVDASQSISQVQDQIVHYLNEPIKNYLSNHG